MVHIDEVEEFVFRAKELALKNGENVRYSLKYVNRLGRVVAKMTDDQICLTHETDERAQIYILSELTEWFFSACTGVKRPRLESGAGTEIMEQDEGESVNKKAKGEETKDSKTGATAQNAAGSAGAAPSGKSKKKKGKKRR